MARCVVLVALLALARPAAGEGPPPASSNDACAVAAADYAAALCLYHAGALEKAAAIFARIVEEDVPHPATLKSRYFLARTRMKQKRWEEASAEWIKIYSLSPSFYEEWSCDFLLGESRRGMGLD